MAHFVFFCSYIFINAHAVYKLEPVSDDPAYAVKVQNRQSRAMIIMVFIIAIFLILSGIRYRYTNTETTFGAIIAIGVFAVLGYGWFLASNTLGIRTMDIFGVVQQMLITQDPSRPVACVSSS
jgi:hypothetical protein